MQKGVEGNFVAQYWRGPPAGEVLGALDRPPSLRVFGDYPSFAACLNFAQCLHFYPQTSGDDETNGGGGDLRRIFWHPLQ